MNTNQVSPGQTPPGTPGGPPPAYNPSYVQPAQYQQQPQYQQPQYQQPGVIVQTQPVQMAVVHMTPGGHMYSSSPTVMQCPHCHQQIVTNVDFETGCCAWLSVGACLLIGCWAGCCLIPLFMLEFKDVIHTCPQCGQYIGSYQRI